MGKTMWMLHCTAAHLLRTGECLFYEYKDRPLWGLPKHIPASVWLMSEYRLQLAAARRTSEYDGRTK